MRSGKRVSDTEPPSLKGATRIVPHKYREATWLVGPVAAEGRYEREDSIFDLKYTYTYSEIIVCDWLSRSDTWERGKLVVRNPSPLPVSADRVATIPMTAWLCSLANYGTEDGGWAIDAWEAVAIPDEANPSKCYVEARIAVALRGICARLNRVGYSWTLYAGQPVHTPPVCR
jgi:hypothetical protein